MTLKENHNERFTLPNSTAQENARNRVLTGIEWLYAHVPDWRISLDIPTLQLWNSEQCICGQLEGNVSMFMHKHRLTTEDVVRLGFVPPITQTEKQLYGNYNYDDLQEAWENALNGN